MSKCICGKPATMEFHRPPLKLGAEKNAGVRIVRYTCASHAYNPRCNHREKATVWIQSIHRLSLYNCPKCTVNALVPALHLAYKSRIAE